MSAWFVEKAHIDVLITAALALEVELPGGPDPTAAGKELWGENANSLDFRYDHYPKDKAARRAEIEAYVFKPQPVEDLGFVLKQTHCYDYQACEHPSYEESASYRFIVDLVIAIEKRVPGVDYDRGDYTWGVHEKADGSVWIKDREYWAWFHAEVDAGRS